MNPVRFVTNKTKLAAALGISRTLLYEYQRLPDAPAPCADNRWSVPAYRKFIASHAKKVKAPNEKEGLQIELLRAKLAREQHDLSESQQSTREKILSEVSEAVSDCNQMLRTEFFKMRNELCPRFEGKSAREMYKMWTDREREAFQKFCDALRKQTGAKIKEENTRPVT